MGGSHDFISRLSAYGGTTDLRSCSQSDRTYRFELMMMMHMRVVTSHLSRSVPCHCSAVPADSWLISQERNTQA